MKGVFGSKGSHDRPALVTELGKLETSEASTLYLYHQQPKMDITTLPPKMDITTLPNDIFLLIVAYLSPDDLILSRRVSRQFYDALTESELCRHLLTFHYPRARELRNAHQHASIDWSRLFGEIAGRYHHLRSGSPRSIEKHQLGKSFVVPQWSRSYGG